MTFTFKAVSSWLYQVSQGPGTCIAAVRSRSLTWTKLRTLHFSLVLRDSIFLWELLVTFPTHSLSSWAMKSGELRNQTLSDVLYDASRQFKNKFLTIYCTNDVSDKAQVYNVWLLCVKGDKLMGMINDKSFGASILLQCKLHCTETVHGNPKIRVLHWGLSLMKIYRCKNPSLPKPNNT